MCNETCCKAVSDENAKVQRHENDALIKKYKEALRPEWKVRRRLSLITLLFCAFWIAYIIVVNSGDSQVHQAALYALTGIAVGLIMTYIGGAAWDDSNVMKSVSEIITMSSSAKKGLRLDE